MSPSRSFPRSVLRASLAAGVAAACLPAATSRAELLVGLTNQNSLIAFDSSTPGTITTPVPVSGLVAGDALVGIDRRPQALAGQPLPGPNNGRVYGVGVNATNGSARVYALNETTGVATVVSTLAADPADATAPFPFATASGTGFGVDFNPTVDRLRVVSNTGQNLRINVDSGLTQLDVPLAYQTGDANFGQTPLVTGVAYTNNFGGATTTVLRGVDAGRSPDLLVIHTNPNGGLLQTSTGLPFDGTNLLGYDVSGPSGTPYFSVNVAGANSNLYAGDTLVGPIGGGVALVDLAAPVGTPVPEPAALGTLGLCAVGLLARRPRHAPGTGRSR